MDRVRLGFENTRFRANQIARIISKTYKGPEIKIYGVPSGGIQAALLIMMELKSLKFPMAPEFVEDPRNADIIVDDIIDSGRTRGEHQKKYGKPFYALVDKMGEDQNHKGVWVEFFWERMKHETGIEDNITRILEFIGEQPDREGLRETPKRVAASYSEIFSGYGKEVKDVIKTFEECVPDEMILCRGVEFFSTCQHHMLPFFGTAHIAYIPDKKIIGLSKLARILEIFSRRLQIQEKLTEQVTAAIVEALDPKGAACVLTAKHFCCTARGVNKQGSEMVTSSLLGVFRQPEVRQEFFKLIEL